MAPSYTAKAIGEIAIEVFKMEVARGPLRFSSRSGG
jgi:hypothetical protein